MKAIVIDVDGDTRRHVFGKVGIGVNGEAKTAANAAMAVLRLVQSTLQHLPSELMDPFWT